MPTRVRRAYICVSEDFAMHPRKRQHRKIVTNNEISPNTICSVTLVIMFILSIELLCHFILSFNRNKMIIVLV